jgi:peptidoglycan/LPS O-acetylase OafA/YrhL
MASRPSIPLPDHIPALDGLRGIAVLLVLAVHTDQPHTLKPLLRDGWVGVDLFFVLSGFLITRILLKTPNSPQYFTNFYVRRVLRIWPVYLAMLVFVFACERYGLLRNQATNWCWVFLLTLTQNFYIARNGWDSIPDWLGPTWSLGIEEQFYLIWPLLVRKLSLSSLKKVCLAVIFATPFLRAAVSLYFHGSDGPLVLSFCRLDSLCFGTLLAVNYWTGDLNFSRWVKRLAPPSLALFIVIVRWPNQAIAETALFSLLAILFAGLLALCLVPGKSVLAKTSVALLSFAPLRFVGKISYCLYLVHTAAFAIAASHPAQRLLIHVPGYHPTGWSQVAANWLFAFAISTASWYLYESPILSLKRHFGSDPSSLKTRAASGL